MVRLRLFAVVSILAIIFAACGDDDPAAPVGGGGGGAKAFNTSQMPDTIPGVTIASGNISFDPSGNLFLADQFGTLHRFARSTGDRTLVAANINGGNRLLCVVFDPGTGLFYTGGTAGNICSVDPSDGSSQQIINAIGDANQQLLIAPAGFGSFGGALLHVGQGATGITAIDQTANPVTTSNITTTPLTDAEFAPDGTLYATDYNGGQVVTVSAGGTVTPFAGGLSNPEGIAIDTDGSRMWVAETGAGQPIVEITIPGAVVVDTVATPVLTGGFYPTGLVYDGVKNLIHVGGTSVQFIDFVVVD